MHKFRVECNFGCRYFDNASKALKYFNKCISRHLDAEIWLVAYAYCDKSRRLVATQWLLDYSPTALPKY